MGDVLPSEAEPVSQPIGRTRSYDHIKAELCISSVRTPSSIKVDEKWRRITIMFVVLALAFFCSSVLKEYWNELAEARSHEVTDMYVASYPNIIPYEVVDASASTTSSISRSDITTATSPGDDPPDDPLDPNPAEFPSIPPAGASTSRKDRLYGPMQELPADWDLEAANGVLEDNSGADLAEAALAQLLLESQERAAKGYARRHARGSTEGGSGEMTVDGSPSMSSDSSAMNSAGGREPGADEAVPSRVVEDGGSPAASNARSVTAARSGGSISGPLGGGGVTGMGSQDVDKRIAGSVFIVSGAGDGGHIARLQEQQPKSIRDGGLGGTSASGDESGEDLLASASADASSMMSDDGGGGGGNGVASRTARPAIVHEVDHPVDSPGSGLAIGPLGGGVVPSALPLALVGGATTTATAVGASVGSSAIGVQPPKQGEVSATRSTAPPGQPNKGVGPLVGATKGAIAVATPARGAGVDPTVPQPSIDKINGASKPGVGSAAATTPGGGGKQPGATGAGLGPTRGGGLPGLGSTAAGGRPEAVGTVGRPQGVGAGASIRGGGVGQGAAGESGGVGPPLVRAGDHLEDPWERPRSARQEAYVEDQLCAASRRQAQVHYWCTRYCEFQGFSDDSNIWWVGGEKMALREYVYQNSKMALQLSRHKRSDSLAKKPLPYTKMLPGGRQVVAGGAPAGAGSHVGAYSPVQPRPGGGHELCNVMQIGARVKAQAEVWRAMEATEVVCHIYAYPGQESTYAEWLREMDAEAHYFGFTYHYTHVSKHVSKRVAKARASGLDEDLDTTTVDEELKGMPSVKVRELTKASARNARARSQWNPTRFSFDISLIKMSSDVHVEEVFQGMRDALQNKRIAAVQWVVPRDHEPGSLKRQVAHMSDLGYVVYLAGRQPVGESYFTLSKYGAAANGSAPGGGGAGVDDAAPLADTIVKGISRLSSRLRMATKTAVEYATWSKKSTRLVMLRIDGAYWSDHFENDRLDVDASLMAVVPHHPFNTHVRNMYSICSKHCSCRFYHGCPCGPPGESGAMCPTVLQASLTACT